MQSINSQKFKKKQKQAYITLFWQGDIVLIQTKNKETQMEHIYTHIQKHFLVHMPFSPSGVACMLVGRVASVNADPRPNGATSIHQVGAHHHPQEPNGNHSRRTHYAAETTTTITATTTTITELSTTTTRRRARPPAHMPRSVSGRAFADRASARRGQRNMALRNSMRRFQAAHPELSAQPQAHRETNMSDRSLSHASRGFTREH